MGAMCEIYSAELDGLKVAVKVPRRDCEEPAVAEHDLEVICYSVVRRFIRRVVISSIVWAKMAPSASGIKLKTILVMLWYILHPSHGV